MHLLTHRLARFMVFGALAAAIIMAVRHGAEKGSSWDLKIALILGLVCVAVGEFLSWHNAATAYFERRAGSLMLWSILGATLSAGTIYTNFSTTAGNNDVKAGIQKTAFVSYEDTDKTERELTERKAQLQQELKLAPTRTAEAARAAQDNAKAHRFWKLTNGCKETKGQQTRDFCSSYASAVADESNAGRALTNKEELAAVTAQLADVRKARAAAPAAISDDQANITMLSRVASMDKATARTVDAMVAPWLVQAMLVFGGILLAAETFRGKTLPPWINWARIASWFKGVTNEAVDANGNKVVFHHTVERDEALRRWANHPSVKGLIAT